MKYLAVFLVAFFLGLVAGTGIMLAVMHNLELDALGHAVETRDAEPPEAEVDDEGALCPDDPDRKVWDSEDDPYSWDDTNERHPESP